MEFETQLTRMCCWSSRALLPLVLLMLSAMKVATLGHIDNVVRQSFADAMEMYVQNSTGRVPIPTNDMELQYFAMTISRLNAETDRLRQHENLAASEKLEKDKQLAAEKLEKGKQLATEKLEKDKQVAAEKLEKSRQGNIFRSVRLASGCFVFGLFLLSNRLVLDDAVSAIREIATVFQNFVEFLRGTSLLSILVGPFRISKPTASARLPATATSAPGILAARKTVPKR